MAGSVIQLPKSEDALATVPAQPAVAPMPPAPAQPPIITVATALPAAARWEPPVLGSLAVVFGVASLFTGTLVLAPLGLVFALVAGLFRQVSWAVIGGAAAVAALATSTYFWTLVGLVWLYERLF
jgi:hypothetical protein